MPGRPNKNLRGRFTTNHTKRYGYSYDWVFVFKVRDEWDELDEVQKEFSMKRVIGALVQAGLDTAQFYSVQRDEVYCKIRCPLSKLVMQVGV